MSYPAVTYTFANGTDIDATAINKNFSDVISGLSDGDKDINMRDATFAGSVQVDTNMVVSGNLVDTSGYIGVNTVNPTVPLHVDGSAFISGSLFSYPTDGGYYDASGDYSITGMTPTTEYTYQYRRIGAENHVNFDMTGIRTGDNVVLGMPSEASTGTVGVCRMVLDLGASYANTPSMCWCPEGSSDMTITKNFGDGTAFTAYSLRLYGTFSYFE